MLHQPSLRFAVSAFGVIFLFVPMTIAFAGIEHPVPAGAAVEVFKDFKAAVEREDLEQAVENWPQSFN